MVLACRELRLSMSQLSLRRQVRLRAAAAERRVLLCSPEAMQAKQLPGATRQSATFYASRR
jgi:hypothetical protein